MCFVCPALALYARALCCGNLLGGGRGIWNKSTNWFRFKNISFSALIWRRKTRRPAVESAKFPRDIANHIIATPICASLLCSLSRGRDGRFAVHHGHIIVFCLLARRVHDREMLQLRVKLVQEMLLSGTGLESYTLGSLLERLQTDHRNSMQLSKNCYKYVSVLQTCFNSWENSVSKSVMCCSLHGGPVAQARSCGIVSRRRHTCDAPFNVARHAPDLGTGPVAMFVTFL